MRRLYTGLALAVLATTFSLGAGPVQAAPPTAAECAEFLTDVVNAGRPPTSGEIQYLHYECGIDYYSLPGTSG